MSLATVRSCLC